MNLTPILNEQIKRLAETEGVDDDRKMTTLMRELAQIAGVNERAFYLYRSGRHRLPADLIPALCERFGSLALLHALEDECRKIVVEVPDGFDLALTVSQTVRHNLEAYGEVLRDFETDGGVDEQELPRIRELLEQVIGDAYRFLEIAKTDCERRQSRRSDSTLQTQDPRATR